MLGIEKKKMIKTFIQIIHWKLGDAKKEPFSYLTPWKHGVRIPRQSGQIRVGSSNWAF